MNWRELKVFGVGKIVGILLVTAGFSLAGCSDRHEHHADHDHEDEEGHVHEHHAPHGGTLGMLGDHVFQLEFLVNKDADELELYILDGEAENFIRVSNTEIEANAVVDDKRWPLLFEAVANEATGETKEESSHFVAAAKGLAAEPRFVISFDKLELLGQVFEDIDIPYPEGLHKG